jgi:sterol desaturase/sphingolipid hydroxylase (fatty acid hydroxylase superfamily)
MTFLAFFAGAAGWTLTEYVLHRFVFHNPRARASLAVEHRKHHRIEGYFTPAREKAGAAVVVIGALAASGLVVGAPGFSFALGFVVAYVGYELLHRGLHVAPPRNAIGRWLRRHHLHHHFRNPASNHGVTTPVWDVVFGTYEPSPTVAIPRPRAPGWLLDASGEPDPRYAAEYPLIGRS